MVMVRVFLLGIIRASSYPITETLQVKSVLGVSSPFEVSSCSMQIRAGSLFCIGLFKFDHGQHLPGTPSPALETSVRYEHKQRFSG